MPFRRLPHGVLQLLPGGIPAPALVKQDAELVNLAQVGDGVVVLEVHISKE